MNQNRSYQEAEAYLLSIPKFTKKNSREQTREFYEFLGKPLDSINKIHIAGTNGKGSVCAYMNEVLLEAGFHVGMFTSPHLVSMRERFRIDGKWIPEDTFLHVFDKLQEQLQKFREITNDVQFHPTFFEYLFFMAALYFEEEKPDMVLLETGLGGRLDATNVITNPLVCVITEIGMDHMEYLGHTLQKIAAEKAGIMKAGSKVVYSGNRRETMEVIEEKAGKMGVSCKCVPKPRIDSYRISHKKIDFSFYSRYYDCIPLTIHSTAVYQVENIMLALTALEETGLTISKEAMEKGVRKCRWEGRMEEILPCVFLDGAHNEDGIDAFLKSVEIDECKGNRWLLFSAVADKEYEAMKNKLIDSGLFSEVYTAPLKNSRGLKKEDLERIFENCKVVVCNLSVDGLEEILKKRAKDDYVYVAGSLYLVGEIKEHWDVS